MRLHRFSQFPSNVSKKKFFFKNWQVYDWRTKWLIMSGYMDLRRPRVYRRSNVGLVFQGHPSNFKVTWYKTSPILTQIGHFRSVGRSQLSNPSDLPCCNAKQSTIQIWCINVSQGMKSVLTHTENKEEGKEIKWSNLFCHIFLLLIDSVICVIVSYITFLWCKIYRILLQIKIFSFNKKRDWWSCL